LTVVFLGDGEMTVTDLVAALGCTRFALSQHLKELIALGILEFRSDGVWRYYSCKSKTVKAVIELLDQLAMADKLPKAPESLGT
jgi:DNA-binding transcriptional ArsR family regulator